MSIRAWVLACAVLMFTAPTMGAGRKAEKKDRDYHPKAADLVIQGAVYDLKGQYDQALNVYHEALIYDPNSASIYLAIAKDYILLGKAESALQMLQRSIELDPDFPDSHKLLAALYHRKNNLDLAEKEYNEILRLDPQNVDAHLNLAAIFQARNEPQKAERHYEALVNAGRASREIMFQLGSLYFKEKDFASARRIYQSYVHQYPEDEQGYLAVGAVLLAESDSTAAIEWYQQTHRENEHFIGVREELVTLYIATEHWDEAIAVYEDAVARDSTNIMTQVKLANIRLAAGDTVRALSELQAVTETFPADWRGFYQLGVVYYTMGEWQKSIPHFLKSAELNSKQPDTFFRLGIAYQQVGDLALAEQNYRKAHELVPRHPGVSFSLGQLLFQAQRYDEAIQFLQKSVQSSPKNAVFVGTLAAAYDELGEHQISESYYRKALNLDANNATILNNYSYSLAERGVRLQEALEMVKKAVEKEPENGAFLDTLGWIYFKLDDYQQALHFVKKSLEIRSDSAEVLEHLGDIYRALGQAQQAVANWRKAQELEPHRRSVQTKLDSLQQDN